MIRGTRQLRRRPTRSGGSSAAIKTFLRMLKNASVAPRHPDVEFPAPVRCLEQVTRSWRIGASKVVPKRNVSVTPEASGSRRQREARTILCRRSRLPTCLREFRRQVQLACANTVRQLPRGRDATWLYSPFQGVGEVS